MSQNLTWWPMKVSANAMTSEGWNRFKSATFLFFAIFLQRLVSYATYNAFLCSWVGWCAASPAREVKVPEWLLQFPHKADQAHMLQVLVMQT